MRDLGKPVLLDPLVNKGTAFLWSERERFHLRGLLPARMVTMEEQVGSEDESGDGSVQQGAREGGRDYSR